MGRKEEGGRGSRGRHTRCDYRGLELHWAWWGETGAGAAVSSQRVTREQSSGNGGEECRAMWVKVGRKESGTRWRRRERVAWTVGG